MTCSLILSFYLSATASWIAPQAVELYAEPLEVFPGRETIGYLTSVVPYIPPVPEQFFLRFENSAIGIARNPEAKAPAALELSVQVGPSVWVDSQIKNYLKGAQGRLSIGGPEPETWQIRVFNYQARSPVSYFIPSDGTIRISLPVVLFRGSGANEEILHTNLYLRGTLRDESIVFERVFLLQSKDQRDVFSGSLSEFAFLPERIRGFDFLETKLGDEPDFIACCSDYEMGEGDYCLLVPSCSGDHCYTSLCPYCSTRVAWCACPYTCWQ